MSRRTNIKTRASNKESGHRLYASDMGYREQMRTPTDKAFDAQVASLHSERKKPYRSNSYEEMEHFREPPPGINWGYPGFPGWGVTFPDYPWEVADGVPNAVELGGFVIFKAWTNDCYCPGERSCGFMNSTQKIVGMSLAFPALHDATGLASSGGSFCIETEDDALLSVGINVEMVADINGREIQGSNYITISKCPDADCEAACDPTATIGYTTQQMGVNDQQTLTVQIGGEGATTGTYEWNLSDNGGGTLVAGEGASVIYTAPATNAECADNPTITLSCEGVELDSLDIAVTAVGASACAYRTVVPGGGGDGDCSDNVGIGCGGDCCCSGTWTFYECDGRGGPCNWSGDFWTFTAYGCPWDSPQGCGSDPCDGIPSPGCVSPCTGTDDLRTAAMKTAGCCPEALL